MIHLPFPVRPALLGGLALAILAAAAPAGDDPPAGGGASAGCLSCHADAAKGKGHAIDGAKFERSVHGGKEGCARCHFNYETTPHPKEKETAGCADCHSDQAEVLAKSVHGKAPAKGSPLPRAPACADCHGTHDVFRAKDRESRLFPLEATRTCGACHFGHEGVATEPVADLLRERYADDTHGRGLLLSGLIVAPSCVTCHGGHGIRSPKDPAAPVHRDHAAETCGRCHVGVLERYRESIHGRTPRGDPGKNAVGHEPATCIDCHRPHQVARADTAFRLGTVETCMECHGKRGETYRGTFHGRMTQLGTTTVAVCADCHTAHSMQPASDPRSSVHPSRRTETCARCHEGATAAFASYSVHADPEDARRWPVLYWFEFAMRWILNGTWMAGGLHMVLWLLRGLLDRGRVRPPVPASGRWYERWRPTYRYLHMTLMFSFLTLAATGLPVLFHDDPRAQALYAALGGAPVMRNLHRAGGALTAVYFIAYFVHLGRRMFAGEKGLFGGATSMVPRAKDLADLATHVRWFLRGGEPPRFDRWAYWHKFYFWAEMWGVGVMSVTGLIMWFPIAATRILPGEALNVAHVVHSHEALLATSVIFVLHSFHMNLRPGKFPMDPVAFTGRVSEEELRFEHPLEYERMAAEGRLDREALPPPDAAALRRARRIGGTMLGIALLLLAFMISTLL